MTRPNAVPYWTLFALVGIVLVILVGAVSYAATRDNRAAYCTPEVTR